MNERQVHPFAIVPMRYLGKPKRRTAPKERAVPSHLEKLLEKPELVERGRLLELIAFISEDGPFKPPQMDTVSNTRLTVGGFNLTEANHVFDQFAKVTGQEVADDDRTYRALSFALRVVLSSRKD